MKYKISAFAMKIYASEDEDIAVVSESSSEI